MPHDHNILWLPYRGAPQTIQVIKDAVLQSQTKPIVRMFAEEVTKYLPSKDTVSEALAFHHFVTDKTRYMRDPRTVELVRAPWIVLELITKGHIPGLDCDDITALLLALGAASGAECRAVTVAFTNMFFQGQRQYSHVFAQLREPRTQIWITTDPVAAEKTREMQGRVKAAKYWPIV